MKFSKIVGLKQVPFFGDDIQVLCYSPESLDKTNTILSKEVKLNLSCTAY